MFVLPLTSDPSSGLRFSRSILLNGFRSLQRVTLGHPFKGLPVPLPCISCSLAFSVQPFSHDGGHMIMVRITCFRIIRYGVVFQTPLRRTLAHLSIYPFLSKRSAKMGIPSIFCSDKLGRTQGVNLVTSLSNSKNVVIYDQSGCISPLFLHSQSTGK